MNASKIAYEEDFKIHSNYLGIMLSPLRRGAPWPCALAGGGHTQSNEIFFFHPPPFIPPPAGDTGRIGILLKENILKFTNIT